MDERKGFVFFGTPLSDSLQNDDKSNDGPINTRRARLNEQQTVRDEQGRRRFHGAFTGGFSAGYYNSVGTIEGFRPKSFVTHKRQSVKDDQTKFSHKPEDYMDEEDFGEFGIAPKKIRLVGNYNNDDPLMINKQSSSGLLTLLRPVTESIGERILRSMTKQRRSRTDASFIEKKFTPKTDFHGLGYEPLKSSTRHKTSKDISQDRFLLDGFLPAQNLDATCSDESAKYPLPVIDISWKMPARTEPYIPPLTSQEAKQYELNWQKTQESTSAFTMKFSNNTTSLLSGSDALDIKSGLVSYNDLKAHEKKKELTKKEVDDETCTVGLQTTIHRRTVEWRPCSLLCKHFNVPNPYPDNSYFGVKPSLLNESKSSPGPSTITIDDDEQSRALNQANLAPIQLRRSIFNVTFDHDPSEDARNEMITNSGELIDSDDEPQVVQSIDSELHGSGSARGHQDVSSDDDSVILVDNIEKPEPELIVLSSSSESSSSSSSSPSPSTSKRGRHNVGSMSIDRKTARRETKDRRDTTHSEDNKNNSDNDLDDDTYGPPLPPTRERLLNVDQHHYRSPSSGKTRKLKKGKHKRKSKSKKRRHKSSKT